MEIRNDKKTKPTLANDRRERLEWCVERGRSTSYR